MTILVLLLVLMTVWALDKYERTTFRHLIASYSQAILMIQLVITFVFQVPIIHSEVSDSSVSMACDMFGLLLHNIKTYAVSNFY